MSEHWYYDVVRQWDDAELMRRLAIKRPTWPCGEHLWRIWKKAIREEATKRGLLG